MKFLICIAACLSLVAAKSDNTIVCNACNGKGKVWTYESHFSGFRHRTSIRPVKKRCKMCNGTGVKLQDSR